MPRHAVRVRAGEGRASLHDDLTNKITYELEAGRVAWVQPRGTAAARAPFAIPKTSFPYANYRGVPRPDPVGAVIEHGQFRWGPL